MSADFPTSLHFDGIAEFVAVARLGTFTAAADELGLTKSAVARAVSRLEARLDAKLLHRTTRRLTLTSHGEAWLEHCAAALDELQRGESVLKLAQNNPAGQVRIDLPTVFGRLYVMPVLLEIAAQCPALQLDVSFTDRLVDLIDEGIDLAVRIGEPGDSTDLVARKLGVQQMVICGSPAYVAARGAPRNADDLAHHDCIAGWNFPRRAAWLLKQPDGSLIPHTVPIKHKICDFEMVLATIKAGHGLGQLPLWMVQEDLTSGRLVTVLDEMSGGVVPIHLIWARTPALPAKIRVIVDALLDHAHRLPIAAPAR
ncbi:MAG TPA: LysR family transcriptional regulator [Pararobbsia sp.]|jgi:DNA-binding transcriptional LysR family regulator|nr:LysR family transcriptional regulator [Pararobbsia sp.]